jgi:hypothetical protein
MTPILSTVIKSGNRTTEAILPTAAPPCRELRLRCVVRPDRAQAVLLERLGLRLPERLRMPRAARTMSRQPLALST